MPATCALARVDFGPQSPPAGRAECLRAEGRRLEDDGDVSARLLRCVEGGVSPLDQAGAAASGAADADGDGDGDAVPQQIGVAATASRIRSLTTAAPSTPQTAWGVVVTADTAAPRPTPDTGVPP
jgi:hypothetical protein